MGSQQSPEQSWLASEESSEGQGQALCCSRGQVMKNFISLASVETFNKEQAITTRTELCRDSAVGEVWCKPEDLPGEITWGYAQAAGRVGCALLLAGKSAVDHAGSWLLQLLAKIKPVIVPAET